MFVGISFEFFFISKLWFLHQFVWVFVEWKRFWSCCCWIEWLEVYWLGCSRYFRYFRYLWDFWVAVEDYLIIINHGSSFRKSLNQFEGICIFRSWSCKKLVLDFLIMGTSLNKKKILFAKVSHLKCLRGVEPRIFQPGVKHAIQCTTSSLIQINIRYYWICNN